MHKLTEIPVVSTAEQAIIKTLVTEDEDVAIVTGLFNDAKGQAKPKALFKEVFVESVAGANVVIDGASFTSEVLAANLKNVHRVFAYVCTCGEEVDAWSRGEKDYFKSLWLDMIKQMFLSDAVSYLQSYIKNAFGFNKLSSVNPGSGNVDNWPISQQRPLFDLIGGVYDAIGVTLTESFLMVPIKSTSGILFPSEHDFVNCALCFRENCKNRRAAFDDALYGRTFK